MCSESLQERLLPGVFKRSKDQLGLREGRLQLSAARGAEPVCCSHAGAVASILVAVLAAGDFVSCPWSEGVLNGSQDIATVWTWYTFHLKRNVFFVSWRACLRLSRGGNSLVFLSSLPREEGVFLSLAASLTWRMACTLCSLYLKVLPAFLATSFQMFSVVISVHQATNS